MKLFEKITVCVDREGDKFRAYAFNEKEENITSSKSFDSSLAVSQVFENLRVMALEAEAKERMKK